MIFLCFIFSFIISFFLNLLSLLSIIRRGDSWQSLVRPPSRLLSSCRHASRSTRSLDRHSTFATLVTRSTLARLVDSFDRHSLNSTCSSDSCQFSTCRASDDSQQLALFIQLSFNLPTYQPSIDIQHTISTQHSFDIWYGESLTTFALLPPSRHAIRHSIPRQLLISRPSGDSFSLRDTRIHLSFYHPVVRRHSIEASLDSLF